MCETLFEETGNSDRQFPTKQCLDCEHFLVVITDASDPSKSVPLCVNTRCERNIENVRRGIDHPLLRCPNCGGSTTLRRAQNSKQRWCQNCGKDVDIPTIPPEHQAVVPAIQKLIEEQKKF